MSDEANKSQPYVIIVGEGPHDAAAVEKILTLWGFHEERDIKQVPSLFSPMIPRNYPVKDGYLGRFVPHPSFFRKGDGYVVTYNAGGMANIGSGLFKLLGGGQIGLLSNLRSLAVLADMDRETAEKRTKQIQAQMDKKFSSTGRVQIRLSAPTQQGEVIIILDADKTDENRTVPAFLYLFPDNTQQGTLEKVLLAGAENSYPDLLTGARNYLDQVNREKYPLPNFNAAKVAVGVIANVLKPGKANQVSIADDDWFTVDTLVNIPLHHRFSGFLNNVLQYLSV